MSEPIMFTVDSLTRNRLVSLKHSDNIDHNDIILINY